MKKSEIGMIGVLSVGLLATPVAQAENGAIYDYAQVTHVEPIERQIEHRIPRESCWTEQVRHERSQPQPQSDSYLGPVLGGVIGGALGHAVGHRKRNKQVGAAVGAVVGATIGHEVTREKSAPVHQGYYYSHERRCETQYDLEYETRIVGYWVDYDYLGHSYRTRTTEHPGQRLRVRVRVDPA